jgi:hypothetical protein
MDMDSRGLLRVGRGVDSPYFLMGGLEMAQALQDLMLGHNPNKLVLFSTPGHLAEGLRDMREPQHKPMVEVGEAQEAMDLSQCLWDQPIADELDLGWVHMHTFLIHDVS